MKWHQTIYEVSGRQKLPMQSQVVVGLVGDRALMCYINEDGLWIDNDHGCAMWKAPDWWTELPEEI